MLQISDQAVKIIREAAAAIRDGAIRILDALQGESVIQIPPEPAPPQPIPSWATAVNLADWAHASRALRGGRNEFLPGGVLRAIYPVNEAEAGVSVKVNYSRHVTAGFDLRFERPFDFPYGLKIFRIQSFDEAAGLNAWDVILVAVGARTAKGAHGRMIRIEAARNAGDWWGSSQLTFEEDVWYRITITLNKGEAGKPKSGSLLVFVNGSPALDLPSVEVIRGGGRSNDGPVNRLHFGGWYSNGAKGNPDPDPISQAAVQIRNAFHGGGA